MKRDNAILQIAEILIIQKQDNIAEQLKAIEFTCDTCETVSECPLAFDMYNVNGDCLYSK